MWRARALWVWCWVLLLSRVVASAGWIRNRSCITVAPTIAPAQRRHLTVDGITGPLRIGVGDWDSSKVTAWALKTLAEEIVGVHVELRLFQGSMQMLYAVGGCKDPLNHMVDPRCGVPGDPVVHIVASVWMVGSTSLALTELSDNYPGWYPLSFGSVGFGGRQGLFVKNSSLAAALEQHHVPLDYYLSYTHPALDFSAFFDSPLSISHNDLLPCSRSDMGKHSLAKRYVGLTGDRGGVTSTGSGNSTVYAMECLGGPWWMSPSCRADLSRCIPLITGGNGWDVEAISQRAFAWKMPIAVATAKDWGAYVQLISDRRVMFYWWFPDSTFLRMSPARIFFPVHDEQEWERSVMYTDDPTTSIEKWAYNGMQNRSNVGTEKVLELLRRMHVSSSDVTDLMKAYLARTPGDDGLEAAACEWLNAREQRWKPWIPVKTVCLEGQGLVSSAGTFVDSRAEAETCAWCKTGRVSEQLRDNDGTTYRCKECRPGEFQAAIGETACELCAAGTAATQAGRSSCERCDFGRYATSLGSSQCESCLPGFMTSFLGATSAEACICRADFYRDQNSRGTCAPCPFGMSCKEGSDALGYLPEHAQQHPVTPLLLPGFWSSPDEPFGIFRCEGRARCPGGRSPSNSCAARLESRACAHCIDGFEWNGEECLECAGDATKYVVFPLLPIVLLPIGICLLYKVCGDEYAQWGAWKNGVGATCFIVLQHFHIMNVLLRTNTVESSFAICKVLSDVWTAFQMGCHGFKGFSDILVLQSLGPLFLMVGYLVTWGVSQLVGRRHPAVKLEANRTLNGFFSLIFAFFTGTADTSFTIFKCAPNPSGKHTMVADRSVVCYEGDWNGMLAIGIIAVLLWCVGVSVVFTWAIARAPREFHRASVQARWKFLFVRYKPDVHWWALIFLAKGILVNLAVVFISDGMGQLFFIYASLLVYMGFASHFRPWRHALNNNVDLWMHFSLLANCAALFWFARDGSIASIAEGDRLAGTMLKVCSFGLIALVPAVACAMFWFSATRSARCQKELNLELMVNAISLLATDAESCKAFLRGLDEADFQKMSDAKDVILTEGAAKRSRRGYSTKRLRTLNLEEIRASRSSSRSSSRAAPTTSLQLRTGAGSQLSSTGSEPPGHFERGKLVIPPDLVLVTSSEENSASSVQPPGCLLNSEGP